MMRTRTAIEIAVLLLLVVGAVQLFRSLKISPESLTRAALQGAMVRIHMYMLEHREYPPDLTVLPEREGHDNRLTDGWGRPLLFSVDEEGIITVSSLGRDGKPGGDGPDADIVRRNRSRNEDGSLDIEDEYWSVTSKVVPDDP